MSNQFGSTARGLFGVWRRLTLGLSALIFILLLAWTGTSHAASWNTITAPGATGTMLLLSDGKVMMQRAGITSNWLLLTPSNLGSYITGTFSTTAPMSISRLYFASHVLRDARVWVLGGEYKCGNQQLDAHG